ncbi:MAG: hypothetical protein R3E95_06980 [Thiolinea sp.]
MKATKTCLAILALSFSSLAFAQNIEEEMPADAVAIDEGVVYEEAAMNEEGEVMEVTDELVEQFRVDCTEIAAAEGIQEAEQADYIEACVEESLRLEMEAVMEESSTDSYQDGQELPEVMDMTEEVENTDGVVVTE